MKKFNKYSESGSYHWKKIDGSIFDFSPRLNARYDLAIKFSLDNIESNNIRGLDIGFGDGVVVGKLLKKGIEMYGIEYEKEGVELAKSILLNKGLNVENIRQGDCYNLEFEDNFFDFVISVEVIEHLEDVNQYLKEIYRVLKPNGVFVCTTPQRDPGQNDDYVRDPYHVKEYTASELRADLTIVFNDTKVYGAFPKYLDEEYLKLSSISIINKFHKVWFKIKSKYLSNPYLEAIKLNPTRDFDQLISISKK